MGRASTRPWSPRSPKGAERGRNAAAASCCSGSDFDELARCLRLAGLWLWSGRVLLGVGGVAHGPSDSLDQVGRETITLEICGVDPLAEGDRLFEIRCVP